MEPLPIIQKKLLSFLFQDISLYAEINNAIVGVARSVDGSKYQVSWTEDIETAPVGDIAIKLYDETSYAALRKVLLIDIF